MFNLILKDILIQKKTIAVSIAFGIFSFVAFSYLSSRGIYVLGGLSIVYMLLVGSLNYDEKDGIQYILNSMPTKRYEIVISKYITIIVYFIFAVLIMGILGVIIKPFGLIKIDYMNAFDMITVLTSSVMIYSFILPVYFKFNYTVVRRISMFIYLGLFVAYGIVMDTFKNQFFNSNISVNAILILLSFVLCIISIIISIKFYANKDIG